MLGWQIFVCRQVDGGSVPATPESETHRALLYWDEGLFGLGWLKALAKSGAAIDLGGNGYPWSFTAQASVIRAHWPGPGPGSEGPWDIGPETCRETGEPVAPGALLADCPADEWLKIDAWDQS
ncbi:MAG: hypothetical protein EXR82_10650 [Gammaproteobacteria bacterium]|nr:hypothetical protein [Gammaproteobacteria bacterium]